MFNINMHFLVFYFYLLLFHYFLLGHLLVQILYDFSFTYCGSNFF